MKMLYEVHTDEVTLPVPAIRPGLGVSTPTARKLAVICSHGNVTVAGPGLALAAAALRRGVETHLYFTSSGLDIIRKSRPGNPSNLLAQIVDAGGHLWACRMSADLTSIDEVELYDFVEGIIEAAEVITKTDGAELLVI